MKHVSDTVVDLIGCVLGRYGHVCVAGDKRNEVVFDPWLEDFILFRDVLVLHIFVS